MGGQDLRRPNHGLARASFRHPMHHTELLLITLAGLPGGSPETEVLRCGRDFEVEVTSPTMHPSEWNAHGHMARAHARTDHPSRPRTTWASDATRLPLTFHVKPTRAAHSVISPLTYRGSQSDSEAGISCAIQEGRFGVVSANR